MASNPVVKPVVEVNEAGELKLPEEVLKQLRPYTQFEVEVQGESLVLLPTTRRKPFWETAGTQEWLEAFDGWLKGLPDGPDIPLEALRRENLYD